jgi:hypothetical protein
MSLTKSHGVEWIAASLLLAAAATVFTRPLWMSSADGIPGSADALLNLYTLEQWRLLFLEGRGSWLGGGFFFPTSNTLGYSDAMFLLSVPYAIFRLFGADPFAAYQLTLYGVLLIGCLSLQWLLAMEFQLSPIASAIGTIVGLLSNALFLSTGHTQLFSIALLPIAGILAVRMVRAAWAGRSSATVYGVVLALYFPLLFLTGFYTAWFFTLLVGTVLLLAVLRSDVRHAFSALLSQFGHVSLFVSLGVGAVALAPFFIVYWPVLRQTGGRTFSEVVYSLPQWFDLINVSLANVIWGKQLQAWFPTLNDRPMYWELMKGIGPITLSLFAFSALVLIAAAWSRRISGATVCREAKRRADSTASEADSRIVSTGVVWLALCVSIAVIAAWAVQLRWNGFTVWSLVHAYIPGASAIRAVFRFNLVAALGVGFAIAAALELLMGLLRTSTRRRSVAANALFFFVGAIIIAEQVNTGKTHFLSKSELRRQVSLVGSPPRECQSFYVTARSPDSATADGQLPDEMMNALAMIVAQAHHIPTLNGHSGSGPPGWSLSFPSRADYLDLVSDWIKRSGLRPGVCSLEIETGRWRPVSLEDIAVTRSMSRELATGDFRFKGRLVPEPKTMRPEEQQRVAFEFTNLGTSAWTSISDFEKGKYAVRFTYRWIDSGGASAGFNNRWPIIGTALPGQMGRVEMSVRAPSESGDYVLEIEAVQEWVSFFKDKGNPTFQARVSVR